MQWQKEPSAILNREQTLELISAGQWPGDERDKWRIKSQWLCDFMDKMESESGFVYNAQALHAVEKAEGIGPFDENGSILSILIYNAQGYRAEDKARAQGFEPLTPELVRRAIERKCKVEVLGSTLLGGEVRAEGYRPVIGADGSAFIIAPRKRNRGFRADGQAAVRLCEKESA